MAKFILVLTTTAKKRDAEKIACSLVKKSLSACVQILGPIKSYFVWENKFESAQEYLCLIKTSKKLYPKVETAIRQIHPYQLPEIIAINISQGYDKYLNWLNTTISNDAGLKNG